MTIVLIILIVILSIVLAKIFVQNPARQESACELVRNGSYCPYPYKDCKNCDYFKPVGNSDKLGENHE